MIQGWSYLVAIGTWGQEHQPLLLACSAMVVLVLGAVRWSLYRRPRL